MLYDADIMLAFIEEIGEYLPQMRQHLDKLAANPRHKESLDEAYRLAHTIKGSAAMLELDAISNEGKQIEQTLLPVVEKRAAFTPDIGVTILARVKNVERLLDQTRAEVNGESAALTAEPVIPATLPPSYLPSAHNGDGVIHSPLMYLEQANIPVPPPPPHYEVSGQSPESFERDFNYEIGDALNAPPPPPPGWNGGDAFNDLLFGLPDDVEELPPPPPAFLYNQNPREHFSIPEPSLNSAPPPPPPASLYEGDGIDLFKEFDFPEPPPPPPAVNFEAPELAAVEEWSFEPFPGLNEVSPHGITLAEPGSKPVDKAETGHISGQPDLDLMDLLLEPSELEALEQALFEQNPPAANLPSSRTSNNTLFDNLFSGQSPVQAAGIPVAEPEVEVTITPSHEGNSALPAWLDELDLEAATPAEPRTIFEELPPSLDDVLTTRPLDNTIGDLQSSILDELPSQMAALGEQNIHTGHDVADAGTLRAFDAAPTLRPLSALDSPAQLDQPDLTPSGPLPFNLLEEAQATAENHPEKPLPDFSAVDALFTGLEPQAEEPVTDSSAFHLPDAIEDVPTVRPYRPLEWPEMKSPEIKLPPDEKLSPASSPPYSQLSDFKLQPDNLTEADKEQDEFGFFEFEALDSELSSSAEKLEAAEHFAFLPPNFSSEPSELLAKLDEEMEPAEAELLWRGFTNNPEEDAAISAAVASMQAQQGFDSDEGDDAEQSGEFETDEGEMGAFFLAEAQADLEELKSQVALYNAPGTDKNTTAQHIGRISATLRKAAQMMDLEEIARQSSVLERTASLITSGELSPGPTSGTLFQNALDQLLSLLAPFEAAAANLFAAASAEAVTEPDSSTEVPEFILTEDAEEATDDLPAEFSPAPTVPPVVVQPEQNRPTLYGGSDLDPELAEVFAAEAEEHIQNLDSRLAQLEQDPYNRELLREIRRTAHTLKGSAAMVGFRVVSQTSHLMEDLLDRLYDGTVQVTPGVVELLFVTFNTIDIMVRELAAGKPEDVANLEELKPRYAALLKGEALPEIAESSGGAVLFERKATPAPVSSQPSTPTGVEARRVEEADVAALEAAIAAENEAEEAQEAETGVTETAVPDFVASQPLTQAVEHGAASAKIEPELSVKVPIKRLDVMMNQIGELVINRTMLEQRNQILNRTVDELTLSVKRMQKVVRELETNYEVELLKNVGLSVPLPENGSPGEEAKNGSSTGNSLPVNATALPASGQSHSEFDTLEMDRYTEFHTLSREMTETVDDLAAALRELESLKADLENVVLQQARLTDDLQDRVVKVRLVPVSNLTPRLYRTVRTLAAQEEKEVQFVVSGEHTQLDKTIFEELGDPLLHLVRNAIDHGIEKPAEREAAGKARTATLSFTARTEGSQVVIEVRDDGQGINLEEVRQRAIRRGLLEPNSDVSEEELYDLLFIPGFSTSDQITDISGRGVGLDVVRANIARLKGMVEINSVQGKGTAFIIRLPSTLAITRALLVKVAGFTYAIPLNSIERTVRPDLNLLETSQQRYFYRLEDGTVPLLDLSQLLQLPTHRRHSQLEDEDEMIQSQFTLRRERPLLVVNGPERAVLRVDSLVGQQEVVMKPLGSHLKTVPGVAGATILGSGEVILILNVYELVAGASGRRSRFAAGRTGGAALATTPVVQNRERSTSNLSTPRKRAPLIQVVDDSLSIRKVLTAALEKAGFRVRTSKDGQEALEAVQQVPPDLILMDIEMPRMDGYELTALLKSRESLRHIPVVMLTSRAGPKHRSKAEEVGADGFLIKPYREDELLQIVSTLLIRAQK
ncbi:MAG TPA: Hpt domain-containing protein [Chloroflexia bacterium]|nr:Hpt domain-containing protein [Chloroflexia bacterium]